MQETVKQEAARLGISLSEVRRRRNAATPLPEVLRLEDGASYTDGFGKVIRVTLLPRYEWTPFGTSGRLFFNFVGSNGHYYNEHGIYNDVGGHLVKFNLVSKVSKEAEDAKAG